jgi:hypothetical protein
MKMRARSNDELQEQLGTWQGIAVATAVLGLAAGLLLGGTIRGNLDLAVNAARFENLTRPLVTQLHARCPGDKTINGLRVQGGVAAGSFPVVPPVIDGSLCYFTTDDGQRVQVRVRNGWAQPYIIYPSPSPLPKVEVQIK